MSDGLNFLPRVGEPERSPPGSDPGAPNGTVRFVVNPTGLVDTSISGPVMLQQPPRWSYDHDPDSGDSRAHIPAVVPIFDYPPSAQTPPPGSSDQTLATTEFVSHAMRETVEEAVIKSRHGVDGRFAAAPGDIGEYLFITVPQPGPEMTPSTVTIVTSLDLPPGDWDVNGTMGFSITGSLPPQPILDFITALSTTITFPGWPNAGGTNSMACFAPATGNVILPVSLRILTGVEQTIFLMGYCAFSNPIRVYGYGYLAARRRR